MKSHIDLVHEDKKPNTPSNTVLTKEVVETGSNLTDYYTNISKFSNLDIETEIKSVPIQETLGDLSELSPDYLTEHEEKKTKKVLQCLICEKYFKYERHLKLHIEIAHDGNKPLHCPICEKQTTVTY